MHPDLDAIVEADAAAAREVAAAEARLTAAEAGLRDTLARAAADAESDAKRRLDAAVAEVERTAQAHAGARRDARTAQRFARERQASGAVPAAIATYLRIVLGDGDGGEGT
jgi:hypothetical protein